VRPCTNPLPTKPAAAARSSVHSANGAQGPSAAACTSGPSSVSAATGRPS
jgi:hypothetical protein